MVPATLHGFDLNLLLLFDSLYRERQLSTAAAGLGLSQSAASHSLARLREALGDPLFVRRGRRMDPTAQAESLAPAVRDALRILEQKLRGMRAFCPTETVREFKVGLAEIGELVFFPSFVSRVTRGAPRIALRSVVRDHQDVQAAALRGDIDLGFDFEPPSHPELRHKSLGTEPLVVIARRGHPRVRGALSLEDFVNERRVRIELPEGRWHRLLTALGAPAVEARILATVAHFTSVPAMVMETDAVAVVPRSVAAFPPFAERLQVLDLPIPLLELPVFALWHESFDEDDGHCWLRGFLVERFWDVPGRTDVAGRTCDDV